MATEPADSPTTDLDVINANSANLGDPAAEPEAPATTEPEAATPETPEAEPEKPKQKSWEQRRIDELTRKRREEERARTRAEERAAQLEAELAKARSGTPGEPTPKPAVDEETVRARVRAEMEAERAGREFGEKTGKVLQDGLKTFGDDFERVRAETTETFGQELGARPDFFEALVELPDAARVFYELGQNPERLDEVLRMSPTRMAIELTRMNDAKPAPKTISKAPAPIAPVGGGGPKGTGELDDPDMPMDDWNKSFLRAMQKKGVLR